jgi:mono/diheme cytochrome c family protein
MNARALIGAAIVSIAFTVTGCLNPPGRPAADSTPVAPDKVLDFDSLYRKNCAGCHGQNGKGGAAIGLADPLYLAFADTAAIHNATANGVTGTAMPAFAQSAGGLLTDAQIDAIVQGMQTRWSSSSALPHAPVPPYPSAAPGNTSQGAEAFHTFCAACHGPAGKGGPGGGSIVDPAFLALVSDQGLRTTVIVGRSDLGSPNWCGDVQDKCMSPQEISDVVAWLGSKRVAFPGQPYVTNARPNGAQ